MFIVVLNIIIVCVLLLYLLLLLYMSYLFRGSRSLLVFCLLLLGIPTRNEVRILVSVNEICLKIFR